MANNYWQQRLARAQDRISQTSRKAIEKKLKKYYASAMKNVITDFESVYLKVLEQYKDQANITPADLYKLDKYWEAQAQLRHRLQSLGDKQISVMSKIFETNYFEVYYSLNIDGMAAFSTLDTKAAKQVINHIWAADGKSWSQRIWTNMEALQETLEEGLMQTVVTGKRSGYLKRVLQERFGVAFNNADMLVRTELAHIQTQAAQQRYKDYGIQEMEVWVDEDERTCPICSKHEGERYPVTAKMPVPFHPRCRCCMIPVVETNKENKLS